MAGYLRRQRNIAAECIGRPLRSDEQVHHINGNRRDNRHENLQVLPTREHQRSHKLGRVMPMDVRRKISVALRGKPKSPEHIRNAAAGQRGKCIPPEVREKIRRSLAGRTQTDEQKRRQRAIMKEWWRQRKERMAS